MTDNKIPLAIYLFQRLHQLGVRSILGVPGDYSTQFPNLFVLRANTCRLDIALLGEPRT